MPSGVQRRIERVAIVGVIVGIALLGVSFAAVMMTQQGTDREVPSLVRLLAIVSEATFAISIGTLLILVALSFAQLLARGVVRVFGRDGSQSTGELAGGAAADAGGDGGDEGAEVAGLELDD